MHVGNQVTCKMECMGVVRESSDGHMCCIAFDLNGSVMVQPRVRWTLGWVGGPTDVAVRTGSGWRRVGGHDA